ncbi:MAG: aminopeptidase [Liquorilactobacillus hordei]|uniref:aminopeptidase n=1 Tax=Liquorilactobacillus hordei TaxID=468911 RepID=UPI0039EBC58D
MTTKNFKNNLQKYAELIIKVGVNIQINQIAVLYISVNQQEFAHLLVKEAYKAGASEVIVKWNDTFIQREFLENTTDNRLTNIPNYLGAEADYIVDNKAARISVISEDPSAYAGVNSNKIAVYQKAMGEKLQRVRQATQNNDLSWTVVAAADTAWAKAVFPNLSDAAATERLWEEIFKTTRINQKDPVKAWQQHDYNLHNKAAWLNEQQFTALHYLSPITDLTIGLPKNHHWEGASSLNTQGISFMANMPSEEVFSAADTTRINGYVSSTKPLSYGGKIIEKIKLTFKDGQVINAEAAHGLDSLQHLLETDEGARSLGEVALVPDASPISQSGITFFNTLFDENASNHLALGSAYPFSVIGGTKMSTTELKEAHLNISQTHVDFMVGSPDMNIDGIRSDGTRVPVFRNGNWAE